MNESSSPPDRLTRRVRLNFDYGNSYRRLIEGWNQAKKMEREMVGINEFEELPYFTPMVFIGFRKEGIRLPKPLGFLDFMLRLMSNELNTEVILSAHPIDGIGTLVDQNIAIEAKKRNMVWEPDNCEYGGGYLFPQERYDSNGALASLDYTCSRKGLVTYHFEMGSEHGHRRLSPVRNSDDLKWHISPTEWVIETLINTYLARVIEMGAPTLRSSVWPISFNILE